MTFIIILLALLLERFFHWHHWRHWRWFASYERWLSGQMHAVPVMLTFMTVVLLPLLVIGMLQYFLAGWWWGTLEFIFSGLILLYCLGPDNLWVQTYRAIHELNKQEPAAIARIQAAFSLVPTDHSQAFHQTLVRAIFLAFHQRVFVALFWFVLLGPVGAVLYRIIESVNTQAMTGTKLAGQVKAVLDWFPIRVEAFIFALGGHFTAVFACWKRRFFRGINENDQFLGECGIAALDMLEEEQLPETGIAEQEALRLIDRVLVIGLVILAIGVLLS